jgi:hypothetical protein
MYPFICNCGHTLAKHAPTGCLIDGCKCHEFDEGLNTALPTLDILKWGQDTIRNKKEEELEESYRLAKNFMSEIVNAQQESLAVHIESFAAAFIKLTNLPPDQIVMKVRHDYPGTQTIWFEKKEDQK